MTEILQTARLTLRGWSFDDAPRLFEICGDAEVMRFVGTGEPYESVGQTNEFLNWSATHQRENGFCRWAVVEKSGGGIIGSCGFARRQETGEVELGYLFAREFWHRGFANEAAAACLRHGFGKFGFREIIAITDSGNAASHRVLEKIGFVKRGIERIEGEDNLVYVVKNSGIFNE